MGCIYLLVRIINGGSPRLWLWFGLVAGLGLENKHSMTFFGVGIVAALLLTPERRHFAQKWIWLGGLIALAVALPNVLWQVRHHWPTYELLSNVAHSDKNVVLTPAQFIAQQVLIMNPGTLPLWLGGLIWLLASRDGRRYRARHRLFGHADRVHRHARQALLPRARVSDALCGGKRGRGALVGRSLAMAEAGAARRDDCAGRAFRSDRSADSSAGKLVAYMKAIHFEPPRTETSHTAALPQHFADQFGWEEMVASVAHAYHHLRPEDEKRAAIYCQNYGEAGAIDFFGPKYGLPPAISGHQNYFLWGPRDYTGEVVLVLDTDADDEREQFGSVEDLGQVVSSPWAMPWEQRMHIYLCRDLKGSLREAWPALKKWL